MCLVDICAVCYVSALYYLSGFDSSGAELLSKHLDALRGTERESSSLGKWCFAHLVLADCMRQPEILILLVSSVSLEFWPIAAIYTH